MKTPEEVARECLKLVVDTGRTLSESAEQALRARDAEWREAVEGVAKEFDRFGGYGTTIWYDAAKLIRTRLLKEVLP